MHHFKMRYTELGGHVHVTFFSLREPTSANWINNGTLVFTIREWWDFRQQTKFAFEEANAVRKST